MAWTHNGGDPGASTIGPRITGVAMALTSLSLVTVCLRTYVRASLIRAFGVGKASTSTVKRMTKLTLGGRRLDYSGNMGKS